MKQILSLVLCSLFLLGCEEKDNTNDKKTEEQTHLFDTLNESVFSQKRPNMVVKWEQPVILQNFGYVSPLIREDVITSVQKLQKKTSLTITSPRKTGNFPNVVAIWTQNPFENIPGKYRKISSRFFETEAAMDGIVEQVENSGADKTCWQYTQHNSQNPDQGYMSSLIVIDTDQPLTNQKKCFEHSFVRALGVNNADTKAQDFSLASLYNDGVKSGQRKSKLIIAAYEAYKSVD